MSASNSSSQTNVALEVEQNAGSEEVESTVNNPEVENGGEAKKTERKKYPKKVHIDPIPKRGKVQVLDQRMNSVKLNFRNDNPKKGNKFEQDRHKRQSSRKDYTNGIKRHIYQYKMVTNDDTLVVMRSKEKGYEKFWTTDYDLVYTGSSFSFGSPCYRPPTAVNPNDSASRDNVNANGNVMEDDEDSEDSDDMYEDETQSFIDLAKMSPSRPRGKPTARYLQKKKHDDAICAKCSIKEDSAEDLAIGSPWISCDGVEGNQKCTYSVHAVCIGFTNARESNFSKLSGNLQWYCEKHNASKALIKDLQDKAKEAQKPKKRSRR